ncbi:very short patch repair endonuclease [Pediococcus acidilactici]|uniref:very short patch repair endonuclease n=1 Tax=Pediococcus acidilactici TaxID=1254 RepID=UPI0022E5129D|nr:very short patch repair endonuclease [Pediococcus acidilactici]
MNNYKFNSSEKTRQRMSRVHSKNGEDEVILKKMLWHQGIRYRKNYNKLPGKPDIAITKYKIAVFIDGEFWHGFDWDNYKTHIKSNRDYWIKKIEYNIAHDKIVNQKLTDQGWTVLRFWSKKVLKNPEYYCQIILLYIREKKELN